MKAAVINRFGPPSVLEIMDMPKPTIKSNEILIEVKFVTVNPIDWKQRKGNHKFIFGSKFPIVLGFDGSGIVKECGADTSKFNIGDEVYFHSQNVYGRSYAEYVNVKESNVVHKPSNISLEEASTLPIAAITAVQALRTKSHVKPGSHVLINGGSSGVGHIAVQIAKALGAKVTTVAGDGHEDLFSKIKPDNVINYRKHDFTEQSDKYDVVFDVVGNYSYLKCKKVLKPNGVYVTTLPRPKVLFHKAASSFSKGKKARTLLMKMLKHDVEFLNDLIENNKLNVHIGAQFEFNQISEAHALSESGRIEGKITIKI